MKLLLKPAIICASLFIAACQTSTTIRVIDGSSNEKPIEGAKISYIYLISKPDSSEGETNSEGEIELKNIDWNSIFMINIAKEGYASEQISKHYDGSYRGNLNIEHGVFIVKLLRRPINLLPSSDTIRKMEFSMPLKNEPTRQP